MITTIRLLLRRLEIQVYSFLMSFCTAGESKSCVDYFYKKLEDALLAKFNYYLYSDEKNGEIAW